MKYVIREKIFTMANKFSIKDMNEEDVYKVVGRFMSIGKKLSIFDQSGREVLFIKEKLFRVLKEYDFYENGRPIGKIKKKISFLRPKFEIKSKYGDYYISGDILEHEFNIIKNRLVVADVSKRWISLSDNYVININDDEEQVFILGMVIVLDQIFYDGLGGSSSNNMKD